MRDYVRRGFPQGFSKTGGKLERIRVTTALSEPRAAIIASLVAARARKQEAVIPGIIPAHIIKCELTYGRV